MLTQIHNQNFLNNPSRRAIQVNLDIKDGKESKQQHIKNLEMWQTSAQCWLCSTFANTQTCCHYLAAATESSTNLGLAWWRRSGEQRPRAGRAEAFNHASNLGDWKCVPTGKPGCTVRTILTNQRRGFEFRFWHLLVALTYHTKFGTTKKGAVLAFITMILFPRTKRKKWESKQEDCLISHGNTACQVGLWHGPVWQNQKCTEWKSPAKKWVRKQNWTVYFDKRVICTWGFGTTPWSPTVTLSVAC